ncbi:hypothetical protein, partial [Mesomycoplasma ovipneumoniae]|uniref:hypothetical protein n=1 Tax=Mesomycoplasma ovipneumoniae TaxID=29562 RepID=UPI002963D01B
TAILKIRMCCIYIFNLGFGLAVKKDPVKKPVEQAPAEATESPVEPAATESTASETSTPVATPTSEPAAPTPAAPTPSPAPAESTTPTPPAEPAPKATEPATQTPSSTGQLAGVYENYPGTDTIRVLHFYVYNKKNPKEFSAKKLKFFVYKSDKSLLNS